MCALTVDCEPLVDVLSLGQLDGLEHGSGPERGQRVLRELRQLLALPILLHLGRLQSLVAIADGNKTEDNKQTRVSDQHCDDAVANRLAISAPLCAALPAAAICLSSDKMFMLL